MKTLWQPTIPALCLPACCAAFAWPGPTPIYRRLLRPVDVI